MRKLMIIGAAAVAAAVPALSHADAAPTNLALGSVATASSVESAQYPGSNAVDGDPATRWSSAFSDPQTLQLDLGARSSISEIKLTWEASYGKAYKLEVSNDGQAWTQVAATDTSDGGVDDYPGLSATGRYVKFTGTARALQYGYSLYELEVDGTPLETTVSAAASSYSMPEKDGTVTVPVKLNQASATPVTVGSSATRARLASTVAWNSAEAAFPAGSVMSIVWVSAPALQKFPRNTTSSSEAVTRGALSSCAIGKTVTPLSEMAYRTLSSALKTDFPASLSGSWMRSRTARLSASITIRLAGAELVVGAAVPGVVTVTQIPLSKHCV